MTAHTPEQLQAAALYALPPGWAINKDPAGYFGMLALALAQEEARAELRVDDLMDELDPRTAQELLPEWYRSVGLPDPCVGAPPTSAIGRLQLLARLDPSLRGQSIPVITALAAFFGFAITLVEPQAWTCDSSCDATLYDDRWAWALIVRTASVPVFYWTCDSTCDDPLAWWGNAVLQCEIGRRVGPSITLIFQYGDM
jgi:uncharacterized protein YmfQ (DUF2313 family)